MERQCEQRSWWQAGMQGINHCRRNISLKNWVHSFSELAPSSALKMWAMHSSIETEFTNSIKGWSAKTAKDIGECKRYILYFLISCPDWSAKQLSICQGCWALIPSVEKCSPVLESGYIYVNSSMYRKWIVGPSCLCQHSGYSFVFYESFHGEECACSRLHWPNFITSTDMWHGCTKICFCLAFSFTKKF